MQDVIDDCYKRLGRYLNPNIKGHPIVMGSGNKYEAYQGRCTRTGLVGQIIDHRKSEVGVVPTHTKLLWMVAYQNLVRKTDGESFEYRLSFGCIAFLKRKIFSTIRFAEHIPNLSTVETTQEILRRVIDEDRYLFLCFGKNIDRTLGHELRYSCGTNLEINGAIRIGGIDITNRMLDLDVPMQLARLDLDWDAVRTYYRLRNKKNGLTDADNEAMQSAKGTFGSHSAQMVRLSRQASWDDLRIARWLSR